jgi:putative mRNA 3-end processing factor
LPPEWNLHWFKGILLLLDDRSISFDPLSADSEGDLLLISHAHGDHIGGFRSRKPKIASQITVELYEAYHKRKVSHLLPAFFHSQRIHLGDISVETHSAGHILGASQFLFRHRSHTLVYTGDMNIEKTQVTEAAPHLRCDELIIDSTYGHPEMIFPPREEVYEEIIDWTYSQIISGRTPTFFAYPIGKAQELIKLFNRETDLDVVADEHIVRVNEIYEKYGEKLRYFSAASEAGKEALAAGDCVHITSNRKGRLSHIDPTRVATATTTGLSMIWKFRPYDKAFTLSNHSDFQGIVTYIRDAKPRRVYTFGFFAPVLARWLERKEGLRAVALNETTPRNPVATIA